MKFGGVVPEQAHVDSVMLDSDAKNATVNFSVLVNGEWNAVSAQQRWARVDNEWFFVPQR